MKRSAALLFATAIISTPAVAADYSVSKPMSPVSAFNWTGFYAGGNAGYGWGRYKEELFSGGASVGAESIRLGGGILGAQIGANVQSGDIVWGIEADIQKSWVDGSKTWLFPGLTISASIEVDWFATLRGRVGFAQGASLFYLTGGVAHGEGKGTGSINGVSASVSDDRTGWTVGAGYEAALGNNWSWKLEYLYLDFGKETLNLGGGFTTESSLKNHIVRVGANYRFGY